ncbi:unnamed protein product [Linum tenue]|uniref:Uncharacterized protein n=1 Tax=Linum tenue TaxID=586396 RepID=A0AAV0JC12_9ROSI|nr:unnamed protein product [Linum tenue]
MREELPSPVDELPPAGYQEGPVLFRGRGGHHPAP